MACTGGRSAPILEAADRPPVQAIAMGGNTGLGVAQNRGIDAARQLGAEAVLFLDQDSLPSPGMVPELVAVRRELIAQGESVGAVGPWHFDARHDAAPAFVRLRGARMREVHSSQAARSVAVDFLIASGSLVGLEVIDHVGGLDEEFFIDHVDTDWCLRARAHGYHLFGCPRARMEHRHGDAPVNLRHLGICVSGYDTLRLYYRLRNATALVRRGYVPWRWKLMFLRSSILLFGFHSLLVAPRLGYLRMMGRGVGDGLRGRLGPLESV